MEHCELVPAIGGVFWFRAFAGLIFRVGNKIWRFFSSWQCEGSRGLYLVRFFFLFWRVQYCDISFVFANFTFTMTDAGKNDFVG